MDIEALLTPASGDNPCGRDLDEGLDLNALETAAAEPEEPSIAGVATSDERNWGDIAKRAHALLEQSKDLRVAVIYTRAQLQTQGVLGFANGLQLVRGLLERYWSAVYPKLEDGDALVRINVLGELWGPQTLKELRGARALSLRELGSFSVNDVLVAKQSPLGRPNGAQADANDVRVALDNVDLAPLRAALEQAREHVRAIDALFAREAPSQPVDLSVLAAREGERASGVLDALAQALPAAAVGPTEEHAGDSRDPTKPSRAEIRSREDVLLWIERICEFYARNEPGSPIPLMLQRVKRVVPMDFLSIVRDLADKGVPQLDLLFGAQPKA